MLQYERTASTRIIPASRLSAAEPTESGETLSSIGALSLYKLFPPQKRSQQDVLNPLSASDVLPDSNLQEDATISSSQQAFHGQIESEHPSWNVGKCQV